MKQCRKDHRDANCLRSGDDVVVSVDGVCLQSEIRIWGSAIFGRYIGDNCRVSRTDESSKAQASRRAGHGA